MEAKFETHFAEKTFQVGIGEVDTSIGFGFYLKNADEYAIFKKSILKGINEDPNFLLGFQDVTPVVDFRHGDVVEIDSMMFDGGYDIIS